MTYNGHYQETEFCSTGGESRISLVNIIDQHYLHAALVIVIPLLPNALRFFLTLLPVNSIRNSQCRPELYCLPASLWKASLSI